MIKRKRKAFTIVELVIVIAVIAVLAAVLIPTFSSIINKANESADIQAVRQMNMALMAESAVEKPDIAKVIKILAAAGYNAEDKLVPVSTDHGFYWCSEVNLISLIKDKEGSTPELIFPLDNQALKDEFDEVKADGLTTEEGFYDLQQGYKDHNPNEEIVEIGADTENLIELLQNGGSFKLTDSITINGAISVIEERKITIDLNGKTLTLDSAASLTINGNVKFINGTLIANTVIATQVENPDYDPDYDPEQYITVFSPAISVTGSLDFDDVDITGNTDCIIENNGNVSLLNCNVETNGYIYDEEEYTATYGIYNNGIVSSISGTTFVSNGDYGIYNNGTGTVTSISGATFVSNGYYGIYNKGPIIEISNSTFDVIGWYGIENYGPATIENTTFNVYDGCNGFDNYYSSDGEDEKVEIIGGSFVACGDYVTPLYNLGTMTVAGTTFSENGAVSYATKAPIAAGDGELTLNDVEVTLNQVTINNAATNYQKLGSVYSTGSACKVTILGGIFNYNFCLENSSSITLKKGNGGSFKGLNFDSLTVENIRENLCWGYDVNDDETFYSIASTVVQKEDSTTETFFTLLGGKFRNYHEQTVPEGYSVTMDLNVHGFYMENNIIVNGNLTIASGDIRVGDKCDSVGRIKVKNGGNLYLTSDVEVNDGKNSTTTTIAALIANFVEVEEGGTIYVDGTVYGGETYVPTT